MTTNTDPVRKFARQLERIAAALASAPPTEARAQPTSELIDAVAFAIPASVPTTEKAREIAKRVIEIVRASAPPSAPVGAPPFEPTDAMHMAATGNVYRDGGLVAVWKSMYRAWQDSAAMEAALAQQPAAPSGEAVAEVVHADGAPGGVLIKRMPGVGRNIPHGTMLYAAPQQPAGVDEAMVERAVRAAERFSDEGQITFEGMRAALTAALAAQQQGGAE